MSGKSAPIPPQPLPVQLNPSVLPDAGSSSLWGRITAWASEHKAIVYTIAGVTLVVTAAGVVYYVNDSNNRSKEATSPSSRKNQAKKARRKAKKEAEDGTAKKEGEETKPGQSSCDYVKENIAVADTATAPKAPTVSSVEAEDELPEITEALVATLAEQV
jgi:mitochondrial import receptor subunit TOM70